MRRFACLLLFALTCFGQTFEGDWIAHDFTFASGEKLNELRLHYTTLGAPVRDASGHVRNAVLIMHGTTGTGRAFLSENFAGVLFGKGQPLDAARYYIILPDAIGHGKSSKPSDGLRAHFPKYNYHDMVRAEYLLVHDGLALDHLRLVMGTSMGAMHTWMWGEMYPDFMDALLPLASEPVQIAGRNRIFRDMIIDAIRGDPEWKNGEYITTPRGMITAEDVLFMMTSSPLQLQKTAPLSSKADEEYARIRERAAHVDANDFLYAFEASRDYDPQPLLDRIQAPLFAVNSADDEVNPPELGIMEREIRHVRRGRYILIPTSDQTRGHGTHSRPAVWKNYLVELLNISENVNLLDPQMESRDGPPPDHFAVEIDTTQGTFVIAVNRDWAPLGADRFYHLVRAGFFEDSRFFRVRSGYIAQFGIPGDPRVAQAWRGRTIPDDPVLHSNVRSTVAYAMTGPNTRSTQIYINLRDNPQLVVDKLYGGYGELAGGGMRGGKQDRLFEDGNAYLDAEFPKLDQLLRARIGN